MKKIVLCLVLLTMMLSLCACGGSSKKEEVKDIDVSAIAGTWIETGDDYIKTLILREDMTYTSKVNAVTPPIVETVFEGTFSISGNEITIDYSDMDAQSTFKVTFNGFEMKWESPSGDVTTYIKK